MRNIAMAFSMMAASMLVSAMPIQAADEGMGNRDQCMLVAKNCATSVDSIQDRIQRLDREIAKGAAVYSEDELRNLSEKLQDAHRQFEAIVSGGAG